MLSSVCVRIHSFVYNFRFVLIECYGLFLWQQIFPCSNLFKVGVLKVFTEQKESPARYKRNKLNAKTNPLVFIKKPILFTFFDRALNKLDREANEI